MEIERNGRGIAAALFAGDAGEYAFPFLSVSFRVRVLWDSFYRKDLDPSTCSDTIVKLG
jgi:hypothetical protein